MGIALLVFGLLMFVGLVVIHEFGHFIMARRNGVDVEEFGIGFPPKAKTLKKYKGTEYTLNWLPLGGFVKLKGEHDADTAPGTYGAASLSTKVKIMLAGVVMNLLTAFAILTVVALIGVPQLNILENQFTVDSDARTQRNDLVVVAVDEDTWMTRADLQVGDVIKQINGTNVSTPRAFNAQLNASDSGTNELQVERGGELISGSVAIPSGVEVDNATKNSPAKEAGIRKGDRLLSVEGEEIYSTQQLGDVTSELAGQSVEIVYENESGEEIIATAELRSEAEVQAGLEAGESIGYLGVSTTSWPLIQFETTRYTWSAPIVAGGLIGQFTTETLKGLGSALAGLFSGNTAKATEQVAGPVGIFVVLRDGTLLGIQFMLLIIALISLTLAIMNILPIPALDGGRLFVTLIFHGLKKPLNEKTEDWIHGTGFAVLMLLFILITIVDVNRFF